jgi:hypothetical protein
MQKSAIQKWSVKRLTGYILSQLNEKKAYDAKSALAAMKSAAALLKAGEALAIIRDKLKEETGAWSKWKLDNKLPDTTVNDAIRLFEGAKTPQAVAGMGITEAKKTFVYPTPRAKPGLQPATSKPIPKRPDVQPLSPDDDPIEKFEAAAQSLAEFEQNDVGKIHWQRDDRRRVENCFLSISDSLKKIAKRVPNA